MIIVPVETENHTADALVLILDDVSIERMREADPAEVLLSRTGWKLVNPIILVCHERGDDPELTRLLQASRRDVKSFLKLTEYLQRGRRFRPELGDHDDGLRPLGSGQ